MFNKDIQIFKSESIKNAFKKLDKTAKKILLVVDSKNRLLGTITDGDIRRAILSGKSLESSIREVYNSNPKYIKKKDFSVESTKEKLLVNKIELIPILNEAGKVIDTISWEEIFFEGKKPHEKSEINIPVVIMAGGKGSRLAPFTHILPKPLIPINGKPIIEIIIEEFKKHGVNEFYLMLNYKAKMIELYFNDLEKDYKIRYINEDAFWGTVGSLKLLEQEITDSFIVSNCDVIVKADFQETLNFHREQKAMLTILSSIKYYKIPYGVIRFKEKGKVTAIVEKPEYTFTVNTGVYVFNKEALQFIPDKSHFDITDLIKTLITNNRKILMYLVNESEYIDIGQWDEYIRAVAKLKPLG